MLTFVMGERLWSGRHRWAGTVGEASLGRLLSRHRASTTSEVVKLHL